MDRKTLRLRLRAAFAVLRAPAFVVVEMADADESGLVQTGLQFYADPREKLLAARHILNELGPERAIIEAEEALEAHREN